MNATQHPRAPRRSFGRTVATVVVGVAALVGALVPTSADASPGSESSTACSTANTICATAVAADQSICMYVDKLIDIWQCTPVLLAATGTAQPVRPPGVGGSVTWSGSAQCQYHVMNNGSWEGWQDCPGGYSKSQTRSASWTSGSPQGGQILLEWGQIVNFDSWGTDCVEIAVKVRTDTNARSQLTTGLVTTLETAGTGVNYPRNGGWSYDRICE